ncbi:hypothetical protein M153_15315000610, partial [Pseudoloma neurophilia]
MQITQEKTQQIFLEIFSIGSSERQFIQQRKKILFGRFNIESSFIT